MMEFVLAVAFIVFAWRLRRAARRLPQQPIRIEHHFYHHFEPGPGERAPEVNWEHAGGGDTNVVPITVGRRNPRTRARL